jgi:hypothetical protein
MELSDHDLEQIAAPDRREVDPPILVEASTKLSPNTFTSRGGQFDHAR